MTLVPPEPRVIFDQSRGFDPILVLRSDRGERETRDEPRKIKRESGEIRESYLSVGQLGNLGNTEKVLNFATLLSINYFLKASVRVCKI